MNRRPSLVISCALLAGCTGPSSDAHTQPGSDGDLRLARNTATVQLIERTLPSVGYIQIHRQSDQPGVLHVAVGSASVIHESGYLLTNEHVITQAAHGQVALPGHPPMGFQTIAALSSEDLALIKVESPIPLQPIRLGRSDDLLLGEPVLVIGNPSGLSQSVSTGIVSGLKRSTATEGAFLPSMIQTSAAVSGGNSGGPLINAVGDQIGVVTSKRHDAENINFAIAVDRVREVFADMLSAELRYGFRLGIALDMFAPAAVVQTVAEGSPAATAGIAPGDVIVAMDGKTIRSGFDFHLGLIGQKAGAVAKIAWTRGAEEKSAELVLAELALAEPVPNAGMVAGIRCEGYAGTWDRLPDFAQLTPVHTGTAETPTATAYTPEVRDHYALRFTGFLEVPQEGLYTFYTSSDDGSRLRINGETVVDNDGLHGARRHSGRVRLKKGLHAVEVTFFEQSGDESLEVSWEVPGLARQVVPKEAWFVREAR